MSAHLSVILVVFDSLLPLIMMSASPPSHMNCHTCGRAITPILCKNSSQGNIGRYFAKCDMALPGGNKCNFFRWMTPKSSPTSSQASSPDPSSYPSAFPPSTAVALNTVNDALNNMIGAGAHTSCSTLGCTMSRLLPSCQCMAGRKHCWAAGGCNAKGHGPPPNKSTLSMSTRSTMPTIPTRNTPQPTIAYFP